MAYSHSYDVARKLTLVVQSGTANHYKETLDWMMLVRTDPLFDTSYGILCDFREGTVQLTAPEAFTCGMVLSRFFPGQKIAFVVPGGLAQMLEKQALGLQGKLELRSFSGLRDAEAWLGASRS